MKPRSPLATAITACVLTCASAPHASSRQQAATEPVRFDVVSVKPSAPGSTSASDSRRGRFAGRNLLLSRLIERTYGVMPWALVTDLDWIQRERFDVEGTLPDGTWVRTRLLPGGATQYMPPSPLERVLQERFAIKVHREIRNLPIYRLTWATEPRKFGPGLRQVFTDCAAKPGDLSPCRLGGSPDGYHAIGIPWDGYLIGLLSDNTQRRVVDATGLTGQFDVSLQWTRTPQPASGAADIDEVSLFTALREQLGLKLESDRGPVEVLIVDHIERPSAN